MLFREDLYLESALGRDVPVTLERLPTAVSARKGTESDPGPSLPRATLQTTDLNAAQQPREAGPPLVVRGKFSQACLNPMPSPNYLRS